MKFGASLSRLSAPQWRPNDLDYDEIKKLIKIQTSSPGGCSREFEAQLLQVLDQELERVDVPDFNQSECCANSFARRLTNSSGVRPARSTGDWQPVGTLYRLTPKRPAVVVNRHP